jgi:hypothetical protein
MYVFSVVFCGSAVYQKLYLPMEDVTICILKLRLYLLYDKDINKAVYNRLWKHTNSGLSMTVGFIFGSLCFLRMVH